MRSRTRREWLESSQDGIDVLDALVALVTGPLIAGDLSSVKRVSSHLPGVVKFIEAAIPPPADRSQLAAWNNLLSVILNVGIAAAMVQPNNDGTINLAPVGAALDEVAKAISAL